MAEDENLEFQDQNEKKKQKPGLNSIRPDDYTEQKFKEMAKDKRLSQTEMFNRIFWSYLKTDKDEAQRQALNLEGEINIISKDLNNILVNFKAIAEKAQNTIISIKSNAEQTEKNLKLNIDTLQDKLNEKENRILDLERFNNAFEEIKEGLEKEIENLKETNTKKDNEIKDLKDSLREKNKLLNDHERQITLLERENKSIGDQNEKLKAEIESQNVKTRSVEIANNSLSETIKNMDDVKKLEITSIEARYQLKIDDLELKLKNLNQEKEKEIDSIKAALKVEFEADKKTALANLKLEIAELKSKYADTLIKAADPKQNRSRKKNSP